MARTRVARYRALLTPEAQAEDFAAYVAALEPAAEADAGRIGVVGYCMTGSFALRFAAQFSERVRAAASFHGGNLAKSDGPTSPHRLAVAIKARVHVGHADQDQSAPPEQVALLDHSLAAAGVDFTTEFFAGATLKTNFLCGLGYGAPESIFPRHPRLSFDNACTLL